MADDVEAEACLAAPPLGKAIKTAVGASSRSAMSLTYLPL